MKFKEFLEKLASELTQVEKVERLEDQKAFKIGNKVYPIEEGDFSDDSYSTKRVERLIETLERDNFIHSKLMKDPILRGLVRDGYSFKLVGGAVIDIFEGREPKDYDFSEVSEEAFKLAKFVDTSKSADTYIVTDKTIQILKTKPSDFDFTIAANCIYTESFITSDTYYISSEIYLLKCTLPECKSYKSKLLIPNSYEKSKAIDSLLRIPHWRKKGFNITDNTYKSLVVAAAGEPEYMKRVLGKNS